jgi:hypothetical protein
VRYPTPGSTGDDVAHLAVGDRANPCHVAIGDPEDVVGDLYEVSVMAVPAMTPAWRC